MAIYRRYIFDIYNIRKYGLLEILHAFLPNICYGRLPLYIHVLQTTVRGAQVQFSNGAEEVALQGITKDSKYDGVNTNAQNTIAGENEKRSGLA